MSTRPGLLFIVNSLGIGGAEKQVITLLNHLDNNRFRLHLAYVKRNEELLPQLRTDKLDELMCCDVERRLERKGVDRLRQLITRRRIDTVVCTNTYSMLYGHLARGARRKEPKLVTVFHTTVLQSYKEKAQMLLYQQLFKRCDLLIYVCESQRAYWRERGLGSRPDAVIYNGIDANSFTDRYSAAQKLHMRRRCGFGPRDYVIGLCSGLRPEKAHGDLLQAIAQLRTRGVPAKALLIGEGPERPAIERAVGDLRLRDHVHITGAQEDVRPFIACCDVMTLVSRTETFSLAALEAMALGKPLVMSQVGGASEQILHGRDGLLFDPGDVEELVLHLATLASEPLRAQMGAASAHRVRQLFTVEAMTARYTECFDQLLGSTPRSQTRPESSAGVGSLAD